MPRCEDGGTAGIPARRASDGPARWDGRTAAKRLPGAWRAAVAVVWAGALLLLSACAAGPGGSGGGGPAGSVPPIAPTVSPVPLPSGAGPEGLPTPTVIDPVVGARERRLAWTLVRSGGAELVVQALVGGPPCDAVTGVEVAESASTVAVTVWAGRVPGAVGCDGPQPAMVGIFWVRVPLSAPLGSRAVVAGTGATGG